MRRIIATLAAALVVLPTTLIAQRDAEPRREIETLNREMAAAFNRGDMKAVSAYYADNAIVRSATGVAAVGRKQLDAYWAGIKDAKSWALEVRGVTPAEGTDLIYQTGKSTLVSGSPEHASVVGFLLVWQRQTDGKLKILLDYYHPEPQRTANP
jgi:ketosteroid isomerase-like protein